jgi:Family of unknown function (DUF5754)
MPVTYRGETFAGYNKPKRAPVGSKNKMVVLAKSGEQVKKIGFGLRGMSDFTQHKDKDRRANYLTRSGGIRDGSGKLTKDNKLSANYWARRVLW